MLVIRNYLQQAGEKGIGVFADEFISKDRIVWILEPLFHKVVTEEEYENCDPLQKEYLDKYSTYHACGVDGYFLDLDNTRFVNHSDNPNILFLENYGIALRDIIQYEEVVCNYRNLSKSEREQELGFINKENN